MKLAARRIADLIMDFFKFMQTARWMYVGANGENGDLTNESKAVAFWSQDRSIEICWFLFNIVFSEAIKIYNISSLFCSLKFYFYI